MVTLYTTVVLVLRIIFVPGSELKFLYGIRFIIPLSTRLNFYDELYPHYLSDTAPITPSSANNGKNNYLPLSNFSVEQGSRLIGEINSCYTRGL